MELILLIMAATYVISGKHSKDTAQSAYRAGKEPPGLVKARLRHEAGGARFVTRPGKNKQPKGPGAFRLLIAQRWSNACEKSKTKQEDKLRRWHAWYQERAPHRDQAWRDKQRKKLNNRAERVDKWQSRFTATKDAAAGAKDAVKTAMSGSKDTEQPAAENPTEPEAPSTEQPAGNPEPEPAGDTSTAEGQTEPASSPPGTGGSDQQHSTSAGGVMEYQQAAIALQAAAARVEQFRNDLSAMADGLDGKKWGEEVHGPIRDMDTTLREISADYRDKAGQMQSEGDNVNDAEDAHPYVPGEHVVNA